MSDTPLLGRIKEKLIDSKRRWAEEGRLLTGRGGDPARDRLPPGQHEVKNWPVLDLGLQPQVTKESWRLEVDGAVAAPMRWGWSDFEALPQDEAVSDIHCVTAWSRFDNRWTGVRSAVLLDLVRPLANAAFVILHSHDGYTTNLRLEHFADDGVMLAHAWEGQPISREHGGPVRLVVPKYYFWKSAKWLKRIEFSPVDKPGFWETRGYHNDADPWLEQRYS